MKYLLFVYGEYGEKENHIQLIADFIAPSCTNNIIKYQHGPAGAIYHFESEVDSKKLGKFLENTITDLTAMFFLVPVNDDVMISVDDDIMSHLFNLSDKTESGLDVDNFYENPEKNEDFIDLVNKFALHMEQEVANLIKKQVEPLTLDQILDKILEEGIDNLTDNEKQKLDEYSKG
jgi:hypothetical protein